SHKDPLRQPFGSVRRGSDRRSEEPMAGSLDGIRVLELARYQAGPRGGMILSDLGAEVIKIEKLGGEETRKSEPLVRGQSVYFSVYNRGKKSLCLDMRTERGKEIFAALVPTADMVLQNFRPGVMEKMGFGYDRLCELKHDIILISVSGFGQYGPYRDLPSFDPLGQAMSGLMSLTGRPVGQPVGTAFSLVDRTTALHATIGALAALRHRDRTGEGQVIDCCLLDSALTMVEILQTSGVPVAPVRSIPEVTQDAHTWQREMLAKQPDALAGEIHVPGLAVKMSATPGRIGPVPTPGQHTDEILASLLNYDAT